MPSLSDNDVNLDNDALNVCFNPQVPPSIYYHSNKDLPWLDWRKIVLERQKPRKMWVQANTEISGTRCDDKQLLLVNFVR